MRLKFPISDSQHNFNFLDSISKQLAEQIYFKSNSLRNSLNRICHHKSLPISAEHLLDIVDASAPIEPKMHSQFIFSFFFFFRSAFFLPFFRFVFLFYCTYTCITALPRTEYLLLLFICFILRIVHGSHSYSACACVSVEHTISSESNALCTHTQTLHIAFDIFFFFYTNMLHASAFPAWRRCVSV